MNLGRTVLAVFLIAIMLISPLGAIASNPDSAAGARPRTDESYPSPKPGMASIDPSTGYKHPIASTDNAYAGAKPSTGKTPAAYRTGYVTYGPKPMSTTTGPSAGSIYQDENNLLREKKRVDNQLNATYNFKISSTSVAAKEKYLIGKKKYLNLKNKYIQARKVYVTEANAIFNYQKRLSEAETEEEKAEIEAEFNEKAKNYLIAQLTVLENQLQLVKDKNILVDGVYEAIEFYQQERARIEEGNLTNDELIESATEIKIYWFRIAKQFRSQYVMTLSNRFNSIIKKGNLFSGRFGELIEELKSQGEDTSKLERGLEIFDEDVAKYETIYEDLRQEYLDANSLAESDEVLRKANRLLTAMNHRLMKDFHLIKEMFYHYKKMQQGEEVDSAVLDQIIEEMEK